MALGFDFRQFIHLRFYNKIFKFKPAFTLAEILITLGIIGIVAALTIPTLMSSIQNRQLEVGLKNAYSTLTQALKMYEQDNGYPLTSSNVGSRKLKSILMKYIKNVKDCGWGQSDIQKSCMPNIAYAKDSQNYEFYMNYDGTDVLDEQFYSYFDDGQFVMNNGMLVLLENVSTNRYTFISVDVNGHKKKPNRLGHDLFMFQLMDDGQLLPMGAKNTYFRSITYCSDTSTNGYNGAGCTYRALYEKDFFKNLPK